MLKYVLAISALLVAGVSGHHALAADATQMEQNKKPVLAFYDAVLNKRTSTRHRNISGRATRSTIPLAKMVRKV